MANQSSSSLMRHLDGVGALLKARGVHNIRTAISRRTFYEFRTIKLVIDLGLRKACFLSFPEWRNPSWDIEEPHSVTHLQTVTAIAFRIPLVLDKLDTNRKLSQLAAPGHPAAKITSQNLIAEVLSIQAALDEWGQRLGHLDNQPPFFTLRPARPIESPAIDDIQSVFPVSYDFPYWDNAAAFVYHAMSKIHINTLLADLDCGAQSHVLETKLELSMLNVQELSRESVKCADRICQCLEYFLQDNKKLIGRMIILAPFDAARNVLRELCKLATGSSQQDHSLVEKARFCDMVHMRIQEAKIPIWDG